MNINITKLRIIFSETSFLYLTRKKNNGSRMDYETLFKTQFQHISPIDDVILEIF